jgi:hypothetical protein
MRRIRTAWPRFLAANASKPEHVPAPTPHSILIRRLGRLGRDESRIGRHRVAIRAPNFPDRFAGAAGMRARSAQDIVTKLRQAESLMAQGHAGVEVARALGLMAALYRAEEVEGATEENAATSCLERLQEENARLRRVIADLVLEKRILQQLAKGNW